MNNINRYLKIVRDAVIKPSGNIEEKIINRISHISGDDRSLLDEKFLDFLKKNNSRLYLVVEKIRNNQEAFIGIALAVIFIIAVTVFLFKLSIKSKETGGGEPELSSPKNKAQKD